MKEFILSTTNHVGLTDDREMILLGRFKKGRRGKRFLVIIFNKIIMIKTNGH